MQFGKQPLIKFLVTKEERPALEGGWELPVVGPRQP